jgi:hypothetical protein
MHSVFNGSKTSNAAALGGIGTRKVIGNGTAARSSIGSTSVVPTNLSGIGTYPTMMKK